MRLREDIDVLPLEGVWRGASLRIHPVVLRDDQWVALVDTGFPGQEGALREALRAYGVEVSGIRAVILTHQDLDHIGNAPVVVGESGAEVWAHPEDAPYIEGHRPPLKLSPERLAALPPETREALERLAQDPPRVRVTRLLRDGERIPVCGGIRVVHTPGHTPGHISLYLEARRVLIAGDALVADQGMIRGPRVDATLDMPTALRSVRTLAALDPDVIVCYHGGVVGPGAGAQLRDLAASIERAPDLAGEDATA